MVSYPGQVNGNLTATGTITSSPAGVLNLGADVDLYRLAADQMATDDTMTIFGGGAKALDIATVGAGMAVAEGSNARSGVSTLVAGTVTVANTSVTASTRIQLTAQSLGTVTAPKTLAVTARTPGTSFTITSADNTDTSVVAWLLIEPA